MMAKTINNENKKYKKLSLFVLHQPLARPRYYKDNMLIVCNKGSKDNIFKMLENEINFIN